MVAESSRPLLAASLSVALVKNDDQGNVRLSKNGSNNTARDDVAAAVALCRDGGVSYHRAGRKYPIDAPTERKEMT